MSFRSPLVTTLHSDTTVSVICRYPGCLDKCVASNVTPEEADELAATHEHRFGSPRWMSANN